MILGEFTSSGQAVITVTFQTADREEAEVPAVIDTGFMGSLLLPRSLANRLQLPQIDQEELRLADGSIVRFAVHEAVISWQQEERIVAAHVADGEVLVGVELLRGNVATIEFLESGLVTLETVE